MKHTRYCLILNLCTWIFTLGQVHACLHIGHIVSVNFRTTHSLQNGSPNTNMGQTLTPVIASTRRRWDYQRDSLRYLRFATEKDVLLPHDVTKTHSTAVGGPENREIYRLLPTTEVTNLDGLTMSSCFLYHREVHRGRTNKTWKSRRFCWNTERGVD